MISHISPHIISKLILYLMLHARFSPQTGYFWEISDKIVFHLLRSGKVSFQKLCGPFSLDKDLAIWQVVCLLLCHKNEQGGSQGRRLCHGSFLAGRTLWVSQAAAGAPVLAVCVACARWERCHGAALILCQGQQWRHPTHLQPALGSARLQGSCWFPAEFGLCWCDFYPDGWD